MSLCIGDGTLDMTLCNTTLKLIFGIARKLSVIIVPSVITPTRIGQTI